METTKQHESVGVKRAQTVISVASSAARFFGCLAIVYGTVNLCFSMAELARSNTSSSSKDSPDEASSSVTAILATELDAILNEAWEINGLEWQLVVGDKREQSKELTSKSMAGQVLTGNDNKPIGMNSNLASTLSSLQRVLDSFQNTIDALNGCGTDSLLQLGELEIEIKSVVAQSRSGPTEMNCILSRGTRNEIQYRLIRADRNGNRNVQEDSLLELPLGCKEAMSQYDSNGTVITSLVSQLPQSLAFSHWRSLGYKESSIDGLASDLPQDTFLVGKSNAYFLVWLPVRNNPQSIGVIRGITDTIATKIKQALPAEQ